jgi:hypothetical protein
MKVIVIQGPVLFSLSLFFFLSHVNQKGAKLVVKTVVTSNHQVQQQYRTEAASNERNGTVRT